MSNEHLELPGSERAALRTLVAEVDAQIISLAANPAIEACRTSADQLATTWAKLVTQLALGQAAELRSCPRCKRQGMRAATRCGYCWLELDKLPTAAAAAPAVVAADKHAPE